VDGHDRLVPFQLDSPRKVVAEAGLSLSIGDAGDRRR